MYKLYLQRYFVWQFRELLLHVMTKNLRLNSIEENLDQYSCQMEKWGTQ